MVSLANPGRITYSWNNYNTDDGNEYAKRLGVIPKAHCCFIIVMSSRKAGFTISGLNETLHGIDSLIRDFGQTKQKILTEAATFYKNDAVTNAHVITGKTKGSIKIESISDKEAVISAGFGMPFEEKRSGNRQPPKKKSNAGIVDALDTTSQLVNSLLSTKGSGTPHATMTEAAKKTTKEMPSIIDKHMNELLKRHSAKL